SLRLTLRSWASQQQKNTPPPFKLISGTAYSVDPTCFEECAIDADAPRPTFQATVVPGKILLKEMIQFLKQRDSRMRRGASLTTADTDYGRKTLDRPNPNKETAKMAPGVEIIDLPFPLYISRVRNAYSRSDADKPKDPSPVKPSRIRLSFPLDESN